MFYLILTWLVSPFLWLRIAFRGKVKVKRVLVLHTAKIGDFVSVTQVFRLIKQGIPGVNTSVLLDPVNVPLAESVAEIDKIIPCRPGGVGGWRGKVWLWRELIQDYDAIVILTPGLSLFLCALWAAIPIRVAILPDRRQGIIRMAYPFLTHGERHRAGQTSRETAFRALTGIGLAFHSEYKTLPNRVQLTQAGMALAKELLGEDGTTWVGIGIGAGNRMKALSKEQLIVLCQMILARTGARVVLVGGRGDQELAEQLLSALPFPGVVDATGRFQLADLPSLLARLSCFLGVDSGPTYLADAAGVPVVDYMGPADSLDQRPVGLKAVVINSNEQCAPCSHTFDSPYACHRGNRACIANAPLQLMVEALESILKNENNSGFQSKFI